MTWRAAARLALTAIAFYAIVKWSGEWCNTRITHSIVNINMHQSNLDCKGFDGTSRFAERNSESPGLVRPDIAGAPKISPEPPPDPALTARAGVAGDPSVIIRGDMYMCPIERIVVRAQRSHCCDE